MPSLQPCQRPFVRFLEREHRRSVGARAAEVDVRGGDRVEPAQVLDFPADLSEAVGHRDLGLAVAVGVAAADFVGAGQHGVVGVRGGVDRFFLERGAAGERDGAGEARQRRAHVSCSWHISPVCGAVSLGPHGKITRLAAEVSLRCAVVRARQSHSQEISQ